METIFDWLTVLIFAGLAVLYLQRSAAEEPKDTPWHYLPPATACAAANYAGNSGHALLASILMLSTLAYLYYVLKPRFRA
jgi:hypothetical protein